MKLTIETNVKVSNDINYHILSTPKHFVFNDCKAFNTYVKQIFEVSYDLDMIKSICNNKEPKNCDSSLN